MKRQIITIDEQRCTGCGACVPDCPEGALQIIDGKARLVGDLFCDGLGACIGACPEDAISVEFREAEPYDERTVMREHIIPKGENTVRAHLDHLRSHGAESYLAEALEVLQGEDRQLYERIEGADEQPEPVSFSCPGSRAVKMEKEADAVPQSSGPIPSELRQWPIQMHLINPDTQQYQRSDFLLAADCTAFSMGGFPPELIRGHAVGIACPKLDSGLNVYRDKLVKLIDNARINTLTVAVMEVPCCSGLLRLASDALKQAERKVPLKYIQIGINGDILQEQWVSVSM